MPRCESAKKFTKTMVRLEKIREKVGKKFRGDLLYAGVAGSYLIKRRNDVDVTVIAKSELPPTLFYLPKNISVLAFDISWLSYERHEREPTGLVPSILFKTLQLSKPLLGNKNSVVIPKIEACRADWINVKIKKDRFKAIDRKLITLQWLRSSA